MPVDPLDPPSLEEHLARHPDDHQARLRLADQLAALGENAAARAVLAPLEADRHPMLPEAVARLAALDEREGRLEEAAARWERLLADDIEDDRAWAHLRRLRLPLEAGTVPAAGGGAVAAPTLDSAGGVSLSRFQLLREIGRGSSATVYLARDRALGLELALKVLHPRGRGPAAADLDRRFFHEARTVAALRHPGVVAIYDVDEAARTLVMEALGGGSLRERLRARPPSASGGLPPDEARAIAAGLLSALAYVHERGVVHGDLTPRNVLFRAPGHPVLVDFGIARLRETQPSETLEQPAGTPLYLAPEQFRGAPSSERTDLFGAGALLWEALAGRPMRTHADLVGERPLVRPLPPDAVAAQPRLAQLIERLTAAEPAHRPPDARKALAALLG
jgi:hypothetical protein